MNGSNDEIDLYEVLGVAQGASKAEIKKAYHRAALSSHPDKVPETERSEADIKFKNVSKAYEILFDDDKRHLYDTHGMSAFEKGAGVSPGGVDLDDILAQMMGGMGGMGHGVPPGFGGRKPSKPRKGKDEEQSYPVSLEDLYNGKTVKFASTKNVICTHCKGSGGKTKAKPKQCSSCRGQGIKQGLREVGPGLMTRETVICGNCSGKGNVYDPKDRCKKCQGSGVTKTRKALELYIPRGSRSGESIRLQGEADQVPDQEPGDLVFTLEQAEHATFERKGADLRAVLDMTLVEALCGFSRIVVRHLDGRGIHMVHPKKDRQVLTPGQVIKMQGEGMPIKRSESKGDLYLIIQVKFPDYAWLEKNNALSTLEQILPKSETSIEADEIDEVDYVEASNEEAFGDDANDGEGWEDEKDDEDGMGGAQCQQQ